MVSPGKHAYEAVMTDEGLCRVGWSTAAAAHEIGTEQRAARAVLTLAYKHPRDR